MLPDASLSVLLLRALGLRRKTGEFELSQLQYKTTAECPYLQVSRHCVVPFLP